MHPFQVPARRSLRMFTQPPAVAAGLLIATAAATLLPASPLTAQVTFETRALSGQQAQGTPDGAVYRAFYSPAINNHGQVAFVGVLTGFGVYGTTDTGIWSEAAGSIGNPGLVAREGNAAPGTEAGVRFSDLSSLVLNAAGQTAFRAKLTGSGVDIANDRGIWSEAAGSIGSPALVAREGNAAPNTETGVVYGSLWDPVFNNMGQVSFRGRIAGTGVDGTNDLGIWSEAAGSIGSPALIAREGNAVPGTAPGVNFSSLGNPILNAAGQAQFVAAVTGPSVDLTNNIGLFSETAGSIGNPTFAFREGDAAPGAGPGVEFRSFGNPDAVSAINAAGQIAFAGYLTGDAVDSANDEGIWSEAAGSVGSPGIVARKGDPAPGTGPGVNFGNFIDCNPVINAAGQTAFCGTLTGTGVDNTNDIGIWSEAAGSIGSPALVARKGDPAPGTGPGVNFSHLVNPNLNAAGQIAFFGILTGNGVDSTNDYGIWAADPGGELALIVREGDLFDVDDDPLNEAYRTVASLAVHIYGTSPDNGQYSPLNDAGQLVFSATFTDGSSGVFVANIPEPTTAGLLGVAGWVTLARRRRGGR